MSGGGNKSHLQVPPPHSSLGCTVQWGQEGSAASSLPWHPLTHTAPCHRLWPANEPSRTSVSLQTRGREALYYHQERLKCWEPNSTSSTAVPQSRAIHQPLSCHPCCSARVQHPRAGAAPAPAQPQPRVAACCPSFLLVSSPLLLLSPSSLWLSRERAGSKLQKQYFYSKGKCI